MGMIPHSTRWLGFEFVRKAISWDNGTLCKSSNTVHPRCFSLVNTMPMYSCHLRCNAVNYFYLHCLTFPNFYGWARKLTIRYSQQLHISISGHNV